MAATKNNRQVRLLELPQPDELELTLRRFSPADHRKCC